MIQKKRSKLEDKWNENVFELLITCWFIAFIRYAMFIFLWYSFTFQHSSIHIQLLKNVINMWKNCEFSQHYFLPNFHGSRKREMTAIFIVEHVTTWKKKTFFSSSKLEFLNESLFMKGNSSIFHFIHITYQKKSLKGKRRILCWCRNHKHKLTCKWDDSINFWYQSCIYIEVEVDMKRKEKSEKLVTDKCFFSNLE
jgi:hypothetical protein